MANLNIARMSILTAKRILEDIRHLWSFLHIGKHETHVLVCLRIGQDHPAICCMGCICPELSIGLSLSSLLFWPLYSQFRFEECK